MRRTAFVLALLAAVATTACSSSPTAPTRLNPSSLVSTADAITAPPTDTTSRSGFVLPQ